MAASAPPPTVPAAPKLASEQDVLLSRADATALLDSCNIVNARVIRVHPEAVLYVRGQEPRQSAMTAWLVRNDRKIVGLRIQEGWPVQRGSTHLTLVGYDDGVTPG